MRFASSVSGGAWVEGGVGLGYGFRAERCRAEE